MEGISNISNKWRFEIFAMSAVSRENRIIHDIGK